MARINPDSFYQNGVVLPASYWQALDSAQFATWNGDLGTSHTPSAPIVLGGLGLWICGPSLFASGGSTPLVKTPLGSGVRIVHGDSDWVGLQSAAPNASRNLVQAFGDGWDVSFAATQTNAFVTPTSMARYLRENATNSLISVDPGDGTPSYPAYSGGGRLQMPLRVHHGATLSQCEFVFQVTASRTALPAHQPQFRVVALDTQAGEPALLLTSASTAGWVGDGWVQLQRTSASAYYNSGGAQTFVYPFDGLVVADITRYAYLAQVIDESDPSGNAKAGNRWLSTQLTVTGIADMRPA